MDKPVTIRIVQAHVGYRALCTESGCTYASNQHNELVVLARRAKAHCKVKHPGRDPVFNIREFNIREFGGKVHA